jgi:hypothetical protein
MVVVENTHMQAGMLCRYEHGERSKPFGAGCVQEGPEENQYAASQNAVHDSKRETIDGTMRVQEKNNRRRR